MSDPKPGGPASSTAREDDGKNAAPASSAPGFMQGPGGAPASGQELTPEEQMALFEKELKEHDWGHQPC